MEVYTNDGDEVVPISDLPVAHLVQLVDWGVDVEDVHVREQDAAS
jgi:uncharacterized Zn ribbon protein